MLDNITYSGQWWSPAEPANKIHGVLSFSQDAGPRLRLEGALQGHPTVINGMSSDNTKVTLADCIVTDPNEFWGTTLFNMPSQVYAHRVYLGAHFSQSKEIKFTSLYCQISSLFEWIGKTGFKLEIEGKEQIIRYNRPEPISIDINPELRIDIHFGHSASYKPIEIKLEELAGASFHPRQSKDVEDYLRWMHHLRNFICLATQTTVFPKEILGYLTEDSRSEVKIYYQLDAPINDRADVYDSLFKFNDIESQFQSYMQNWYRKSDLLEPVCQLYFGALYGRFVYLNLKFLCLVQALEAYHRRTTANRELPKPEHRKRVSTIVNSVPVEYKSWLSHMLAYSNEPILRKRLEEICAPFRLQDLIPNRESFIKQVLHTRNYLTHYDKRLAKTAAVQKDLLIVTEQLRALVEICLLKEIGISLPEITTLISKRYQQRLKSWQA